MLLWCFFIALEVNCEPIESDTSTRTIAFTLSSSSSSYFFLGRNAITKNHKTTNEVFHFIYRTPFSLSVSRIFRKEDKNIISLNNAFVLCRIRAQTASRMRNATRRTDETHTKKCVSLIISCEKLTHILILFVIFRFIFLNFFVLQMIIYLLNCHLLHIRS